MKWNFITFKLYNIFYADKKSLGKIITNIFSKRCTPSHRSNAFSEILNNDILGIYLCIMVYNYLQPNENQHASEKAEIGEWNIGLIYIALWQMK